MMSLVARTLICTVAGCVLGGCSLTVVETTPLHGIVGFGPTCHTAMGAYYLPRAVLDMTASTVSQAEPAANGSKGATPNTGQPLSGPRLEVRDPLFVADRTQTLCLDYLAAPNSEDIVVVSRNEDGLLQSVS